MSRLWDEVSIRILGFCSQQSCGFLRVAEDPTHKDLYARSPSLSKTDQERYLTVRLTLEALSGRTTSRADDQNICIGTLFGLDVQRLLKLSGSEQRKELLLQLEYVPTGTMAHGFESMSAAGYDWAPRSFMNAHDPYTNGLKYTFGGVAGHVTPSALEIESAGFILPIGVRPPWSGETRLHWVVEFV